jgi:hypothetical protein
MAPSKNKLISKYNWQSLQRIFGTGHHHDATRQEYNGVPLLYTGAAEHMSTNENPIDRVVWLVQIQNESVSIDRYDIPE